MKIMEIVQKSRIRKSHRILLRRQKTTCQKKRNCLMLMATLSWSNCATSLLLWKKLKRPKAKLLNSGQTYLQMALQSRLSISRELSRSFSVQIRFSKRANLRYTMLQLSWMRRKEQVSCLRSIPRVLSSGSPRSKIQVTRNLKICDQ